MGTTAKGWQLRTMRLGVYDAAGECDASSIQKLRGIKEQRLSIDARARTGGSRRGGSVLERHRDDWADVSDHGDKPDR